MRGIIGEEKAHTYVTAWLSGFEFPWPCGPPMEKFVFPPPMDSEWVKARLSTDCDASLLCSSIPPLLQKCDVHKEE